ncbi:MAG: D-mannonate epimerase, partial [Spirochaetales bacterium]|nr:D-mannonate epimerase [Spirochaetales bacterium]
MKSYYSEGSTEKVFTKAELKTALHQAFDKIGPKKRILILPPDITRFHSRAGEITGIAYNYYRDAVKAIMPALGTHVPMTKAEIRKMFRDVPPTLIR